MIDEKGFIEYEVHVKNADKARAEFDALADSVLATGKGMNELGKFVDSLAQKHPRLARVLRESTSELEKYMRTTHASDMGGAKQMDERYAKHLKEIDAIKAKAAEEERLAQVRAQDKRYNDAVNKSSSALGAAKERDSSDRIGREAAAQERLNKAIADQAKALAEVNRIGDTRGTGDVARTDAAVAANARLVASTREVASAERSVAAAREESHRGIISQRYALYDLSAAYAQAGTMMAGLGIGALAISSNFQTAFSNVERTLDPAEIGLSRIDQAVNEVRNSLVNMTGQIPMTMEELSQIATIGNQMDIPHEKLIAFTGTIARFAHVSEMSIEEVSKAFGGFMAQTGLSEDYLENLGSALAYVSIKSNATEAEILSVSREIAALATGAGMSADQIVGLAGTLSALRVPPERSRGSLETYFQTLRRAVANGGEELEKFAMVVGVTSSELDNMVRTGRGADVLEGFIESLNKVDSVTITRALDELGLAQLRVGNTFTRLSQNVDTFRNHMEYAQSSFIEGAELNRQYDITLQNLSSQWQIFINGINALVEAVSGGAIPSIAELLQIVNRLIFGFTSFVNNNPMVSTILSIGIAAVTAGGSMLLFRALVMRAQGALLAYQVAARNAGVASQYAMGSVRGLAATFLQVRRTSDAATVGVSRFASTLGKLKSALVRTGVGALVVGAGYLADKLLFSENAADSAALSMKEYNDITEKAAKVSQGAGDGASDLADRLGGGGGKGGKGKKSVAKAAEEARKELRLLTDYAKDLQSVMGRSFEIRFGASSAMDNVTSQWNKMREEIARYRLEVTQLTADRNLKKYWLDQAILYKDTVRAGKLRADLAEIDDKLAKAQDGASTSLKGNSNAAIDNREQMNRLIRGYQDYIQALASSGASQEFIQREVKRLNAEFTSQAAALGYNQVELKDYTVAFDDMSKVVEKVPRDVDVEFNGDPALTALAEFAAKLEEGARKAGDAAGSGAADDFNDSFADGLGGGGLGGIPDLDLPFDDLGKKMSNFTKKSTQGWKKFWWDVGHSTISGVALVAGAVGQLVAILDPRNLFKGYSLKEWWANVEKTGDGVANQVRSWFGQIGYVGSEQMNAEFEQGLDVDTILLNGVEYTYNNRGWKPGLTRVGALMGEDANNGLKDGFLPAPILLDGVTDAIDPVTGEFYRLGTVSGPSFDDAFGKNIDPNGVIAGRIKSGLGLSNQEARDLAASMGVNYDERLDGSVDPIGVIKKKIREGKRLTADEARTLAGLDADAYRAKFGGTVGIDSIVRNQFSHATTNADTYGQNAGARFHNGAVRALSGLSGWIAGLFTPSIGKTFGKGGGKPFATGGYTGAGHWLQPKGIVHGGEYVIPKVGVDQRTKLPKPEYMDALRKSSPIQKRHSRVQGYANGGFVGSGTGVAGIVGLDARTIHALQSIFANISPVITNKTVAEANGARARHATVVGG